jgi:uncharacterized membrane protein
LNPVGFDFSSAASTNGKNQAGYGSGPATSGSNHAILWNTSATDYVDLNPAGFAYSKAFGNNSTAQVGYGRLSDTGQYHALLWNGSSSDYIDLQQFVTAIPYEGYMQSAALGIDDYGNIVGWASTSSRNEYYAIVWQPVPEPATMTLLFLGGLAILRRRK